MYTRLRGAGIDSTRPILRVKSDVNPLCPLLSACSVAQVVSTMVATNPLSPLPGKALMEVESFLASSTSVFPMTVEEEMYGSIQTKKRARKPSCDITVNLAKNLAKLQRNPARETHITWSPWIATRVRPGANTRS